MARKNKLDPKLKGRSPARAGGYCMVDNGLLDSKAFEHLSPHATKLLLCIWRRHYRTQKGGTNNGAIAFSRREAMRYLQCGEHRAKQAFDELQDKGFIVRHGTAVLAGEVRRAHQWEVTAEAVGDQPPKRSFQYWQPDDNLARRCPEDTAAVPTRHRETHQPSPTRHNITAYNRERCPHDTVTPADDPQSRCSHDTTYIYHEGRSPEPSMSAQPTASQGASEQRWSQTGGVGQPGLFADLPSEADPDEVLRTAVWEHIQQTGERKSVVARRANLSRQHVSNFLHSKFGLSPGYRAALWQAIDDVKATA